MGYTPTGTTEVLQVYLTEAGRRDLVDGGGFSVKYFALGDSDITYSDADNDAVGIPTRTTDLRGSTANCFSTTARKSIRLFIEK
jgi:hypothetical protein